VQKKAEKGGGRESFGEGRERGRKVGGHGVAVIYKFKLSCPTGQKVSSGRSEVRKDAAGEEIMKGLAITRFAVHTRRGDSQKEPEELKAQEEGEKPSIVINSEKEVFQPAF